MEETSTPQEGKAKSNKQRTLPSTDVDFGKVVTDVAAKWQTTPTINLLWTTASVFETQAANYNTELSMRNQVGKGRPQITNAMNVLDAKMDDALVYVKGYIVDKYKKEAAPAYYAAFGIEHKTNKYVFPVDRNKRVASLELMLAALVDNGFTAKEFGTAFWTGIKTQYETLVNQASATDGTISNKASSKNLLKGSLKKALNSLILVIKANYPDTYKAELRTWGFQKEKY